MYFVDTHCHLDEATRSAPLDLILENAARSGVNRLLGVGFDVASSAEGVALAENQAGKMPEIWAAVGIHPHDAAAADAGSLRLLENMLTHRCVVALGEIGLDFFYDNSPREIQRRVFCEQIELAIRMKKPIITHIRDAKERKDGDANTESVSFLRECHADRSGGIIHCFSGNMKDAEAALELGFYISFAGPVTYPKNEQLRSIAAALPLERILCETDSPYLAPQKYRGKTNEPANVRFVYEKISEARGMDIEEFAQAVLQNGNRLLGWDKKDNV